VASLDFQTVKPPQESRATIEASPTGTKRIDPSQRIVVTASQGQLSDVTVTGPNGPLKGDLSADGTVWTAKKPTLDFGAKYTVVATAIDQRGVTTTATNTFQTLKPSDYFSGSVQPGEGTLVGAGMPVTVSFDRPVKNRAAVERALVVHTPTSIVGAWSWNSPTEVQFRPKKYWPGNIDVTVDLNLKGVEGAKGVYGADNRSTTFHIGPARIIKVDAARHEAKVVIDGHRVRTIPVTSGKPGFETRSGTVLIMSRERTRVMDAATGGTALNSPDYYKIEVEYAMRITYSGEFLHAAPWSVGSQGYANVSHGCVGMSTTNAQWLYDQVNPGDVVEITGTPLPQNLGNGITVWTETWDEWLAGSKAGPVSTVAAVVPATEPGSTAWPPSTSPSTTPATPPGPSIASSPSPSSSASSVAQQTAFQH
jgi:lipoprotein-anchoring transpeptidase ErfK/SrfK